MEAAMGVRDGGGDGGSSGGSTESCVISKEEVVEQDNNSSSSNNNLILEVSDESELLELGLGLSLGSSNTNKTQKQFPGSFKDSPPSASSSSLALRPSLLNPSSTNNLSAGTKRAASPTLVSQVVGWPPVRAYRMNSMANQPKSVATVEHNSEFNENDRKDVIYGTDEKGKAKSKERVPIKNCLFVKVNMDGAAIGRKVNLNAHTSYESLALTLEEMFTNRAVEKSNGEELNLMPKATRPSKLLDGSSEYVLTYEDKDGDWMLVGDVPWGMFLSSVKRLRIMRTSEANGLAPRSEERSAKQRSRPI